MGVREQENLSQDKHSTWLHLVLCLSLNMTSHAAFSIHTCGGALSNNNRMILENNILCMYM